MTQRTVGKRLASSTRRLCHAARHHTTCFGSISVHPGSQRSIGTAAHAAFRPTLARLTVPRWAIESIHPGRVGWQGSAEIFWENGSSLTRRRLVRCCDGGCRRLFADAYAGNRYTNYDAPDRPGQEKP